MNVFEAVKQNVTTRQAAELYGIPVSRNGMAVCPFHNDKNPSMKLDRRFHCFGCQADGDAVDFVSRLFQLPSKEAAMKLADDFGIAYDNGQKPTVKPHIREPTPEQKYRQEEMHCYKVLCEYFHLLQKWEQQYAPQTPEDDLHPLFVEALQRKSYTEYADAGCKMMEVDFPSRNPYLESDFLKARMGKALEACDDYDKYMESIIRLKKELPEIKMLVLAYENTVLEIGTEKFINFCLENDLKDILLVGLSNNEVKDQIIEAGLQVSCYVEYHLPQEEIELAKKSNGFVYLQAKPYETQEKNEKYPTLKDCVQYLRECGIDRPIYCGVGVHAPEDVKLVKEAGGDAAFVGSTILKLHDDIPAMKNKIREFRAQC